MDADTACCYAVSLAIPEVFARFIPKPSPEEATRLYLRKSEIEERARLVADFLLHYQVFETDELIGFGLAPRKFYKNERPATEWKGKDGKPVEGRELKELTDALAEYRSLEFQWTNIAAEIRELEHSFAEEKRGGEALFQYLRTN